MKKAIAIILATLLAIAGLSTALAETASIPQTVPATSINDFVGNWEIAGVVQDGNYYTMAMWKVLTGNSPSMNIDITANSFAIYSGTQRATATISMNSDDGSLSVKDSSGEGKIQLLEDGTIVFWFNANSGTSYGVVFSKAE